eukprot:CAMPEP_0176484594 /NCGR_PEP_ID=MMETSP0200_2-20121128/4540_1 /TAXON_ID=947934 /ORGANISM="Chaetoceros sp., Strain GSL56" /LENGTH=690 /DNA_ID=CAMNT_0017881083 /DNA_START=559 /DNA_END=2628 /DNA_ORIENTATION=+
MQGEDDNQNFSEEARRIVPYPSAHSWMETLVEDEDTLLDYFLGGDNGDVTSSMPVSNSIALEICDNGANKDYSSTTAASSSQLFSTSELSGATSHLSQGESHMNMNEADNSTTLPTPCTPAVQFYPSTCSPSERRNTVSLGGVAAGAAIPSTGGSGTVLSYQDKLMLQQQQLQQLNIQQQGKGHPHQQNQTEQFQRQLQLQQLQIRGQQQQQQQNFQQQVQYPTAQSKVSHQNLTGSNNYQLSSKHPASTSTSASSSSLSLQGMGSSPILQVHQQFQSHPPAPLPSDKITDISPISPALMCTNEVLMLPSAGQGYDTATSYSQTTMPSQSMISNMHPQNWQNQASLSGNVNSTTTNAKTLSQINGQMQLPAWLQHMNNVATLANQVGNLTSSSSTTGTSKQMPLSHGQGLSYATNHSIMNMNASIGSHRNLYSGRAQIFQAPDILPIPSNVIPMAHSMFFSDDQALESTEKRQKRLARNRESARQSRRRKKEMLLNLRSQVRRLHNDIEYIRQGKLETMEHDLMVDKFRILNEVFLDQKYVGQSKAGEDKISSVIRNSGPNIVERRAAIEFQYKALQKAIFPHYRHFILSLSLNDRNFFLDAKDQKLKTQKNTGRVSSKQVGEDISKNDADKYCNDSTGGKSNLSCSASDKLQFWPLLCYELSIGIDQEEKILQVLENLRLNGQVEESRR